MSFRARLALASGAAVAVTIVLASSITFVLLRRDLLGSVDAGLRAPVADLTRIVGEGDLGESDEAREELSRIGGAAQVITASGGVDARSGGAFPVTDAARKVAEDQDRTELEDVHSSSAHLRVLTVPLGNGQALEVSRRLEEVDQNLRRLVVVLAVVTAGGVVAAVAVGFLVARTALAPLDRLTDSMEAVATTTELSHRVDDGGRRDELGRQARSFNRLMEALERSRAVQRQLVIDASHELRTPLTSLRTNIEVLQRVDELDAGERDGLRADVITQMEELTRLIGDVVELARGDAPDSARENVALDELVATVVARAELHARAKGVSFSLSVTPSRVWAVSGRLERAVANVLDNAVKWSPPDGVVEVDSHDGRVVVRDHGPGIPAADIPHVFDRFYRAPTARDLPGSGLGLAIVRDVVEGDGGTVTASNHPDGGAILELRLPEAVGDDS